MDKIQERIQQNVLWSYLETCLWQAPDEEIYGNYDHNDVDSNSIRQAEKDLEAFFKQAAPYLEGITADDEQVAHDFCLTRNGHGAGFWDKPELYNGQENAEKLADIARGFREIYVWADDYEMAVYIERHPYKDKEQIKEKPIKENKKQIIEISKDVSIPGTDVILEKGDKIQVVKEATEIRDIQQSFGIWLKTFPLDSIIYSLFTTLSDFHASLSIEDKQKYGLQIGQLIDALAQGGSAVDGMEIIG